MQCPDQDELGEGKDHMLNAVKIQGVHQRGAVLLVTHVEDDTREVVWVTDPNSKNPPLAWALGGTSGVLLRSVDSGKKWSRESIKLSGSLEITAGSANPSGVAKVVASPLEPSTAFLVGYYKTHWVTTDGGATYRVSEFKQQLESFVTWHPTRSKTALAYHYDLECEHQTEVCFGTVLLTQDSGMTWHKALERVKYPNFGWDTTSQHHAVAVQHMHATSLPRKNSGAWDPSFKLVRLKFNHDGTLNSPAVVLKGGNNFAVLGAYCFVAKAESTSRVSLWVANGGQPLKRARFPAELAQRSYAVLDTVSSLNCFCAGLSAVV